ncbi:hypothetical protein [Rhodoferax sp.]|uniref:hypothetical protein n=1 Tax=Rhodoferax sp. TaxID=50421 RepID=UPI0027223916|nr:hypothetical protein [Rhodoferax sp.]MDO8320163.1 hypothetical protein [Rhodoferax sp.]
MNTLQSTTLVKEFAAHKIQAAIDTAQLIGSQDHPFEESKKALIQVQLQLENLLHRINRPNTSDLLLRQYCKRALQELTEIIPLIGFIERSTDVTGPVEFFGPFSRITKKLLGEDAKLILSSTWQFYPHTIIYPDQVVGVANCVFVGFPVSESDNAFLTPLAAHELGHNIWQQQRFEERLKPKIGEAVAQILESEFKDKLTNNFKIALSSPNDLVGQASWYPAYLWASKQLEECFCDFLGGYLFGPSYLYAFAHFSSPGMDGGDPKYPPSIKRYSYLLDAAKEMNWDLRSEMTQELFDVASRTAGVDANQSTAVFLDIADKAREGLVLEIRELARSVVEESGLLFNQTGIHDIKKQFNAGLPCCNSSSVALICNAGWELFIEGMLAGKSKSMLGFNSQEVSKLVNELMLKSFEIIEIETAIKEQTECSTQLPLAN